MKVKETFNLMNGMASIVRYSQSTLCKPESVLEHTGFVACTCLIIGRNLISLGVKIDMEILLSRALVHDMDEVVTGDVARPTKYFSEEIKSELDMLSRKSMVEISDSIDCYLVENWIASKCDLEGKIVELVDILAVLCKAHNEIVMRGNKTITFGDPLNLFGRIAEISSKLAKETEQSKYFSSLIDQCQIMKSQIERELK